MLCKYIEQLGLWLRPAGIKGISRLWERAKPAATRWPSYRAGVPTVCDYSLYAIRQRLACEGDELVTYRFETGSIGFAGVSDVEQQAARLHAARGLFGRVIDWLRLGNTSCVTAVCMPPGARVELDATSVRRQDNIGLQPQCEATFDEITPESFMYRDALRLGDGRVLLLQSLPEGVRAKVLSLGSNAGVMDEAVLLHRFEEEERIYARRR